MADKKKKGKGAPETPLQDEEVREANLAKAPGGETATGFAKSEEETKERIDNLENRGGNEELISGEPHADHAEGETSKPEGLQAEPAAFVSNGSFDQRTVASPSGPVPVASVARSPEEAERILEEKRESEVQDLERRRNPRQLSPERIRMMGSSEARSVLESKHGMTASETVGLTANAARRKLIELESEPEEEPETAEAGANEE